MLLDLYFWCVVLCGLWRRSAFVEPKTVASIDGYAAIAQWISVSLPREQCAGENNQLKDPHLFRCSLSLLTDSVHAKLSFHNENFEIERIGRWYSV